MTAPQPAPAPNRGGSYLPVVGLIVLLAAAAGGYFLYTKFRTPTPADELAMLRTFIKQASQKQTLADGYADANADLVADAPTDPAKLLTVPDEITFCFVPTDDPGRQQADEADWKDLMAALGKATGKKVRYITEVASTEQQIEAIRAGQLHVTAVNTGLVPAAVNTAGFVPLYAPADAQGSFSYQMEVVVRADGPIQKVEDLRGKRVGLASPSSNSGGKAAMVTLKRQAGLLPGRDYKFDYSGDHFRAVAELAGGQHDAVCVAGDLLARMYADRIIQYGEEEVKVAPEQFRTILKSPPFPALCFGVPHNLPPELRAGVAKAFEGFSFTGTSAGKRYGSQGKVRFAKVDYRKDWEEVRKIDDDLTRLLD
jgi:phosphonate transport system substrate-binding protein